LTNQDTVQRRPIDLIVVEDSAVDAELVVDALRQAGLAVAARRVEDEPAFRAALDERLPDTILADWTLPHFSGRGALEIARERCPEVPFIFVSGTISEASAIEVLRQGATDYVYKHQLQQLGPTLIRAIDEVRTLSALHQSEEKYRQLFENSRDALMLLMPPSWRFTDANHATLKLFGAASKDNFAALSPWDVSPERQPDGRPSAEKSLEMIATAVREGSHFFEWEHRRLNGETFAAEVVLTAIELDGQPVLQATVRDISERKRAGQDIRRLNWALRALSLSNSALVHAGTEQELFQACCDAIAGTEVYPLAWIGRTIDDPAHSIEVAAAAGKEVKYMQDFEVSWGDTPQGNGPTGTAIRTGATQVANNLAESAAYLPWIERARTYGLASSISLPFHVNGTVMGVLTIYSSEVDAFNRPEVDLFEELAEDIGYGITSRRTLTERDHLQQEQLLGVVRLKNALIGTIGAVALTVEKRDPYTAGHQQRVAELCVAIGQELNFSEDRLEGLRLGATIHDLGKISIPAEILAKPIKLTAIEFMLIKNHAQAGFDILKDIKLPWPIATMVLQHHERQDGSGYPQGLKGEQILLESRILAVADVVEAMASHRPYRAALGIDLAVKEIERGRGTVYDAAVVDACIRLFTEKRFAFST
jgi:PAS domain S-box-containing protein